MLQIGLYGFIISHLINLRSSPTWTRSGRWTRTVCYGVVLLNTAYTGLVCNDIWWYGTVTSRDYGTIAAGDITQCAEPIVLTTIAFVVQITLAVRSSKVRTKFQYQKEEKRKAYPDNVVSADQQPLLGTRRSSSKHFTATFTSPLSGARRCSPYWVPWRLQRERKGWTNFQNETNLSLVFPASKHRRPILLRELLGLGSWDLS